MESDNWKEKGNDMKYYKYLYTDESIKSVSVIKTQIILGKVPSLNQVIVLAENSDQLEIIEAVFLRQKYYKRKDLLVVGVTKSRQGAMELVEKILQDTIRETGGYDMKSYILKRQNE